MRLPHDGHLHMMSPGVEASTIDRVPQFLHVMVYFILS
jgi:hypothetical protein